jgi:hypothetical protein
MPASKQQRANEIISIILNADKDRGSVDPRGQFPARTVGDASGWSARIALGHRFGVAPEYASRTGRRLIPDAKWRTIRVEFGGREFLVVNVRETTVHIAYYRPGQWERVFGVDFEGDHQLHQWGDAPIGDDIEEQIRLRLKDLELDPLRHAPPSGDALRNRTMRPWRTRRPEPRRDGPYTVFLKDGSFRR